MLVYARGDKGGDGNKVTAHLADNICQDGSGCHNRQLVGCWCDLGGAGTRQQDDKREQEQERFFSMHG